MCFGYTGNATVEGAAVAGWRDPPWSSAGVAQALSHGDGPKGPLADGLRGASAR